MLRGDRQRGFTYLSALFLIAMSGFGLAVISETWTHSRQREKEAELLWIGNQFRQAIALYYHRSGTAGSYPQTLEDLVEDRRFPTPQRYLRQIYSDPMTGKSEWGLVKANGGIVGVYSLSNAPALRSSTDLGPTYADWKFVYNALGPHVAKPQYTTR